MIFSWSAIATATGGQWEIVPDGAGGGVEAVVDDSRRVGPGALYVSIRGELADGHDFQAAAIAAGAVALVGERPPAADVANALRQIGGGYLRVDQSLAAFQALAAAWRANFANLPVLALTGSSGKTSTRAMLQAIAEAAFPGRVLATEGNTNNDFGVPRNLLRLTGQEAVAILELGTNHHGEIARLANLVQPTVALVVNVGTAHLEFLGSQEGIAREKGSIFQHLRPGGIAVLPADSPYAPILREPAGNHPLLTFGGPDSQADVTVDYLGRQDADSFALELRWRADARPRRLAWSIGGAHQAMNAAAAATAATALGLPIDTIVGGLRSTTLPGMRMKLLDLDGVRWANDAYNSNPDSARASLRWFAEITANLAAGRRLAVLGDMLELGPNHAPTEHHALLCFARELLPGATIVAIGPQMTAAAATCGVRNFPDAPAARTWLQTQLQPGNCILLKGSRGIRLETLLPEEAKP